jgi:hypothetical protein
MVLPGPGRSLSVPRRKSGAAAGALAAAHWRPGTGGTVTVGLSVRVGCGLSRESHGQPEPESERSLASSNRDIILVALLSRVTGRLSASA